MKVTLGEVEYELRLPYKLGAMERAAPYLDAVKQMSLEGNIEDMKGLTLMARDIVGVIWAGLVTTNPGLTLDALIEAASFDEVVALRPVMMQVQKLSGMGADDDGPGEAKGASPQPAAAPQQTGPVDWGDPL